MANAFNLQGRLGLNIAEFKNRLNDANKHLSTTRSKIKRWTKANRSDFKKIAKVAKGIGTAIKIAGTVAAGAFAAMSARSLRLASDIAKLRDATGSTAKEVQALTIAFKQQGLEGNDVGDALNTIADRAQDAKDGMQSYIDDFALIGLGVEDLKNKRPAELFDTFADAVSKTNDPVKRQSAIVRILGDDLGRKLTPALQGGSKHFKDIGEEAEKSGRLMSNATVEGSLRATKAINTLRTTVDTGLTKVFAKLAPFIENISNKINQVINDGVNFDKVFNTAFKNTKNAIGFVLDAIHGLKVAWKGVKVVALGFTSALALGIDGLLNLTADFANAVKDRMTAPLRALLEMASKLPIVGDKIKETLQGIEDFEFRAPDITGDIAQSQVEGLRKAQQELQDALEEQLPSDKLDAWVDGIRATVEETKKATEETEKLNEAKSKVASDDTTDKLKKQKEQLEEFGKSVRGALGTEVKRALDGDFKNIGDSFKELLKQMAADAIAADIANAFGLGGGKKSGPTGSSFFAGAANFIGGLFSADGGGHTGSGSRSGGVDGKGGFPAILHPNETVIDHTKGQQTGTVINNNVTVKANNPQQFTNSTGKIRNQIKRFA